jgi:hypothetical protein
VPITRDEFYQKLNQSVSRDSKLPYYLKKRANGSRTWTVEQIRKVTPISQITRTFLKKYYKNKVTQAHYPSDTTEIELLRKINTYLAPYTHQHLEFLELLGVPPRRWSDYLHGKRKIRVYEFLLLVNLFENSPLRIHLLDHILVENRLIH